MLTTPLLHCAALLALHGGTSVRAYRVWQPQTGTPLTLVAVAFDGDGALREDGWLGPVEFRLRTWVHRVSLLPVQSWRAMVGPVAGAPRGVFALPGSNATDSWQLLIKEPGRSRHLTRIERLAPLNGSSPILSDIVVGQEGTDATWWDTGEAMPVATDRRFTRGRPLEVLVQLNSPVGWPGLRVRFAVTDARGPGTTAKERLSVAMALTLAPGVTTIRRTLEFDRLPPGQYRLSIDVQNAAGTVITRRETMLVLGD